MTRQQKIVYSPWRTPYREYLEGRMRVKVYCPNLDCAGAHEHRDITDAPVSHDLPPDAIIAKLKCKYCDAKPLRSQLCIDHKPQLFDVLKDYR